MIFREYLLPHLDLRGTGRSTPRLMVAKRQAPMHVVWELRFVQEGGLVVHAPHDHAWQDHEDAADLVRAVEDERPGNLVEAARVVEKLGYSLGTKV
ncbi:hypothetical protein [Actinoplanes sp. NPDC051494]|uniref:hypothetical protein n=1 Tax=Actinoplanes sp. NPDC051494 TaxID=3363907 RepID=UPI00379F5AF7